MLPNLIVPGMTKSGTTALWRMFSKHPEFSVSVEKECRYFTRHLRSRIHIKKTNDYSTKYFFDGFSSLNEYISSFAAYTDSAKWMVDISNDYSFFTDFILDDLVAEYEKQNQELPKILFLVRRPSERVLSQHAHNLRTGVTSDSLDDLLLHNHNIFYMPWTMNYKKILTEYSNIKTWIDREFDCKIIEMHELKEQSKLDNIAGWLSLANPIMPTDEIVSRHISPRGKVSQLLVSKIFMSYSASVFAKRLPKKARIMLRTAAYALLFRRVKSEQKLDLLNEADVEYENLLNLLIDCR